MLILKNIVKDYWVGDTQIHALKGLSLEFRKNEFISILGPSGCGKTTLLNIIGGLDRYTDGDLIIAGKSTKSFEDSDWDSYRNHSIGFVFQNYNLIPHQTVLSNVELALTLSGVSKSERKKRAKEALERVGLGDQLNKKPNQMSGGQMQRVAIARALVNDPEILLADEPTGALDSQTSVQIMEILKEVAKERLVVMVTHNPELAEKYSTRIIRLLDGKVIDDTAPYHSDVPVEQPVKKKKGRQTKKVGMSFFTALGLSVNNLLTKKARTILTSFAGSIGIIGIALILSVSTGVQNYINAVQRDTLSSYPLTIQSESLDMSALMSSFMGVNGTDDNSGTVDTTRDKVYINSIMYNMVNSFNTAETNKNNLNAFKKYIDNSEEFKKYATTVQYQYDYSMNIYTKDVEGNIVKSDVMALFEELFSSAGMSTSYMSSMTNGLDIWEEMLPGDGDELVSDTLKQQYDIVSGRWPESYDEVVLVVNKRNELSDMVLYTLGVITKDEILEIYRAMSQKDSVEADFGPWDYSEFISDEAFFKLILSGEFYKKQPDGTYKNVAETEAGLAVLYSDENVGIPLKICGIIRANDDASANMMNGYIGYTSKLTEKIIEKTSTMPIINEQLENKDVDVISGLKFRVPGQIEEELTSAQKKDKLTEYFASLSEDARVKIYKEILIQPKQSYVEQQITAFLPMMTEEQIKQMVISAILYQYPTIDQAQAEQYYNILDEAAKDKLVYTILSAQIEAQYSQGMSATLATMSNSAVEMMFGSMAYSDDEYAQFYDDYMPAEYSDMTYDEVLEAIGYVSLDDPEKILIYCDTFENKDMIAELIADYNKSVENEDDVIEYTDYIALLLSSITTIINAISYVLIAFVAISLIVSSIMIGIITYISVLERTKEIGILRSIGASKGDVSRVFNAETLIVGLTAGLFGIGTTLLILLPGNLVLHALTGISTLSATLPIEAAIILVLISMALTLIAGIIPSMVAAKKDPVVALRSE